MTAFFITTAIKKALAEAKPRIIAIGAPKSSEAAWDDYIADIEPDLAKVRELKAGQRTDGGRAIQHYTTPAVVHRIASGMFPSDPHVKIVTVATTINYDEVRKASGPVEYNPGE